MKNPNMKMWLGAIGIVLLAVAIAVYLPEKYTIMKPKVV